MNYLLGFLAFNVIVIVHELGHFLAAKKFGIKVLEFSLFIGPKLYSIQKGDTLYSIRLFPIMAYVKMEGEEEASESATAFSSKPKYARALTAFGGPLANLLLAIILMTTVFSFQGFSSTKVALVAENSPMAAAGIKAGDKIISYQGNKTYMDMDVMQFLYVSKGKSAEIEYLRNGEKHKTTVEPKKYPESNSYKLGVSLSSKNSNDTNVITDVTPDYPAAMAGLQANDRIIRINDTEITSYDDMRKFLDRNGNKEVEVVVLRDNKEVSAALTPKIMKIPEQYELGLQFAVEKGNILVSLKNSVIFSYSIVRNVVYSLVWLATGQVHFNQMMGPIGMVSSIGEVIKHVTSFSEIVLRLFYITGLFSIAIGASNLIPFPMLDGNRILLIGIEAIRRKPLKPEVEAFISMVGFVLIIALAIYVAFNDLVRLVNG